MPTFCYTAQSPVKIEGETAITVGGTLVLTCLLSDDRVPYNPQWQKDSLALPAHVIVV